MLKGKIIKNISDTYTVKTKDGIYECKARGKFRDMKLTPLVGDNVYIDAQNCYILEIEERKNELDRPKISNVDYGLIVTSLKKPNISYHLLDKEICSITLANIKPIICFTKLDLATKEELQNLKKIRKYYEHIGIPTFTNKKIRKLTNFLKNSYVVLTGQTGAGKSSLINKMDVKKELKVGEISEALGRGKHTTRHTEFFLVKHIWVADTPGFSALELNKYTKEEIRDSFKEFDNAHCEYKNCMHEKEENCEIKKKIEKGIISKERYKNYLDFIK